MEAFKQIQDKKQEIIRKYVDFFSNLGYSKDSPVDLITSDDSILFTNSTIVPWKKYLYFGNIPNPGIFMNPPQYCLRLRVFNDKLTSQSVLERTSERLLGSFKMLGILCEGDRINSLQEDVANLLLEEYSIPKENIRVFISDKNNFIDKLGKRLTVIRGNQPDEKYKWQYGARQYLFGEGAKINLLQKNGTFPSIGQIIQITSPTKVSYEFGVGVETFLSRLTQDTSYNAWAINHCVSEKYQFKTLLDLFSCLGTSLTIPPTSLSHKHKREIRRLSRRISHLERMLKIQEEVTEESIIRFINLEFNQNIKERVTQELNEARMSLGKEYDSFN